jgi:phage baseplate assembly protein W
MQDDRTHVAYPYGFDGRGRTALVSRDDHIRQMIELVLFTAPGERVNRPTFGSGVLQLVFTPNSNAVAAALQLAIQGALQLWLGDLVQLDQVTVVNDDAQLTVSVSYFDRARATSQTVTFVRRTD